MKPYLPKPKDKRIQIFSEPVEGVKHYIHRQFEPNSTNPYVVKAYVRKYASSEQLAMNAVQDPSVWEFVINWRAVDNTMYIEYRGGLYQILSVDDFEGYKTEVKIQARLINNKDYSVVEWEES